jgi:hypothetical protein
MSLNPIPKPLKELRTLTNSINNVKINEEERKSLNITRAQTL